MSGFRQFLLGLAVAMAATGLLGWSGSAEADGTSQNGLNSVISGLPDLGSPAPAQSHAQVQYSDPNAPRPGGSKGDPKDLVLRGDAVCTVCHNAQTSPQVMQIAQTPMGNTADRRTPTCTSCHGESLAHRQGQGLPDRVFGTKSPTPSKVQNQACLTCHQDGSMLSHWAGSTHQLQSVSCAACHRVHAAHDPVQDKRTQPAVCFTCHKGKRAQFNLPSHHPIPEGKIVCSDCHNPMGSVGPHLLKRASVNDTCYQCHMEKRGPFVHNHEPVTEDCTICHNPHGTVTPPMLNMRPPMLCHQCHSPHGGGVLQLLSQQGIPGSANLTSGKNLVNYTMARGCLNCHTEVHGSNNPVTGVPLGNPTPQFMFR
jgi:DmsE family decaheme c-type cytochrome